MKITWIASALFALMAVPLAHADDTQPKDSQSTDQQSTTSTQSTDQQSSKDGQSTDEHAAMDPVNVLFDTNSATIKNDADTDLAAAVDWAKCNPKAALILEGHADPRGTQNYNMVLSAQRAAAVRQKLVDQGVRSDRIVISVFGKNGPQRDSYAQDRRVTVRPAAVPVDATELQALR